MTYNPFYSGGFTDLPDKSRPAVAAAFNGMDAAIIRHDNQLAAAVAWDVDSASANGVQRVRSSTENYLANASFENWLNGTSVAPNGWTLAGDATVSRSATATLGSFSTQIVYGTANSGEFYQDIGVSNLVDYTFSAYVQRVAGAGSARMVAQQEGGGFAEYVSVVLPLGGGWQLALLTVKPAVTGLMRVSFKSGGTVTSTWLIDEVQAQESKAVATTFQHRIINDTSDHTLYGSIGFAGTIRVPSSTTGNRPSAVTSGAGAARYDTSLSKPIWSDGAVWRDATGTAV